MGNLLRRTLSVDTRTRAGKGYELTVLGMLLQAKLDTYLPLVDDQGIDGVIRFDKFSDIFYFDIQIKGSKTWNGIRCHVNRLTRGSILILYCNTKRELLWFLQEEAREFFPPKNPRFGDVFLREPDIARFKAEGRGELAALSERLERVVEKRTGRRSGLER